MALGHALPTGQRALTLTDSPCQGHHATGGACGGCGPAIMTVCSATFYPARATHRHRGVCGLACPYGTPFSGRTTSVIWSNRAIDRLFARSNGSTYVAARGMTGRRCEMGRGPRKMAHGGGRWSTADAVSCG